MKPKLARYYWPCSSKDTTNVNLIAHFMGTRPELGHNVEDRTALLVTRPIMHAPQTRLFEASIRRNTSAISDVSSPNQDFKQ